MKAPFSLHETMEQRLAYQVHASGRSLFKVAFDILHDAAAAEDACQQAFLKAWEHQDSLRSAGALRAWLTQTVIHESLAVYRRRRTEGRANQARVTALGKITVTDVPEEARSDNRFSSGSPAHAAVALDEHTYYAALSCESCICVLPLDGARSFAAARNARSIGS